MLLMAPDIVTPTGLRPRSYFYKEGDEFAAKTGGFTVSKSSTSGGYPTTNSWYRNADNIRQRVVGNASTSKFGHNTTYHTAGVPVPGHHTRVGMLINYPTRSGNSSANLRLGTSAQAYDLMNVSLNPWSNVADWVEVEWMLPAGVAGQPVFFSIYSNHGQYANYDFYFKEVWTA